MKVSCAEYASMQNRNNCKALTRDVDFEAPVSNQECYLRKNEICSKKIKFQTSKLIECKN